MEAEDGDQCGTNGDGDKELQYHEAAQNLCEKINSKSSLFFFFMQISDFKLRFPIKCIDLVDCFR